MENYQYEALEVEEKRHSRIGMVSLVIAIVSAIFIFSILGVAIAAELKTGGLSDYQYGLVGIGIFFSIFISFIGSVLGIIGFVEKKKKKVLGILGLIINMLVILIIVLLMAVGSVA